MFKKAISIKNPWAFLICAGIKDVENRSWKTNYRGKVYIHVSKKPANNNYYFPQDSNSRIIGSIEIIDCITNLNSPWAISGMWHWVLKNPVLFKNPTKKIKGKLSFWTIPETVSISI